MRSSLLAKKWIEEFIIKWSICPYAKPAFDRMQYLITDTTIIEYLSALEQMNESFSNDQNIQTILICFEENMILDQALDILEFTEDWLEKEEITEFQTVLFHPEYLHADEEENSPIHYTNRSPVTIIQFIKMDAIQTYHDPENTEKILTANRETLKKIGTTELEKLLDGFNR